MRTTAAIVRRGGRPKAAKHKPIRLLVADDHVLILEGLTAAIGRHAEHEAAIDHLGIRRFSLYVMGYGAPVGYQLGLRRAEQVQALSVQNGNAYDEGLREFLDPIKKYWTDPRPENRTALQPIGATTLRTPPQASSRTPTPYPCPLNPSSRGSTLMGNRRCIESVPIGRSPIRNYLNHSKEKPIMSQVLSGQATNAGKEDLVFSADRHREA